AGIATAARVAGRLRAEAVRGLDRLQVRTQHPAAEQHEIMRGDALAVERRGGAPTDAAALVAQRHDVAGYSLLDLSREQALALEHVLGGEERRDRADELHRAVRLENDVDALRLEGSRAQLLQGASRGLRADGLGGDRVQGPAAIADPAALLVLA